MVKLKARIVAAMGVAAAVVAAYALSNRPPARPRYIFVNETANREHDLALKMSLKLAEGRSGAENALVLLAALPPATTIDAEAAQLFERLQIGRTRSGRGVLYVYSERENLFKIEVGYALEGLLPDVTCHRLEAAAQSYMLSDMPQDFLSELLITVNLALAEKRRLGEDDYPWAAQAGATSGALSGGAGVQARGYRPTVSDIERAVARPSPSQGGEIQPGTTPREAVDRYLAGLAKGFGDPTSPLLTAGSRIFRAILPRSLAYQVRVARSYERSLPYQIVASDRLAYAVFKPGYPNLPLVLRRGPNALWYIDEPKSWAYFHRFEDGSEAYPTYDDIPLLAALREAGMPRADAPVFVKRVATPALLADPTQVASAFAEVAGKLHMAPNDSALHAQAGDLYLFEAGWLSKASEEFEAASRLSPQTLAYHWRLYDLYVQTSRVEGALAELHVLATLLPGDAEVLRWRDFYDKQYAFAPGDF